MGEMIYPKSLSAITKRTYYFAALTILTGLLLSGCTGAPAAEPVDSDVPSPTASTSVIPAPKPNAAQKTSLMDDLEKIDPALGTQRTVALARQGCRTILAGDPEQIQLAFADKMLRSANVQSDEKSGEKAKKIIDFIKNSEFCKTES